MMPKFNFGPKDTNEAVVFAVEELRADIQIALVRAMKEEGLTQAQLAKRVGLSPAAVSQFLDDDANLTIESIAKLFLALGRSCKVASAPLEQHFECVADLKISKPNGRWLQEDEPELLLVRPLGKDANELIKVWLTNSSNLSSRAAWANDNMAKKQNAFVA